MFAQEYIDKGLPEQAVGLACRGVDFCVHLKSLQQCGPAHWVKGRQ